MTNFINGVSMNSNFLNRVFKFFSGKIRWMGNTSSFKAGWFDNLSPEEELIEEYSVEVYWFLLQGGIKFIARVFKDNL